MWWSGQKCGRASKLTGDDDGWGRRLCPVVRTEVREVTGVYILLLDALVQNRFGHHFRGLLVETLVEISGVWTLLRPFEGVRGKNPRALAIGVVGPVVRHGGLCEEEPQALGLGFITAS